MADGLPDPNTPHDVLVDLAYVTHDALLHLDALLADGKTLGEFAESLNVTWLREHPAFA